MTMKHDPSKQVRPGSERAGAPSKESRAAHASPQRSGNGRNGRGGRRRGGESASSSKLPWSIGLLLLLFLVGGLLYLYGKKPSAVPSVPSPVKKETPPSLPPEPKLIELTLNPPSSMVVDVTQPPFQADPTGSRDSTQAIQAAVDSILRDAPNHGKPLYFPAGTYLISDTITADHQKIGAWGQTPLKAMIIRLLGESRSRTILKLKDHAPGFNDPNAPKAVFAFYEGPASNISFFNAMKNMTVDIGAGNPGAIGVDYHVNNGGGLEYVTIRSSDPQKVGHTGLRMHRQLGGIGVHAHLRIEGFRRSVHAAHGHVCYAFEEVELLDASECAIYNEDKPLSFFHLRTRSKGPVLINANYPEGEGNGSQVVFIDSRFEGPGKGVAIDNRVGGHLFLRNVSITGYDAAIEEANGSRVAFEMVRDEYINGPLLSLGGGLTKTLHLKTSPFPVVDFQPAEHVITAKQISDIPKPLPFDGRTTWIVVDGGANNKSEKEWGCDADLLQAAIDSGAWTIALPGRLDLAKSVTIRGKVQRIFGLRQGGQGGGITPRHPLRNDPSKACFYLEDTDHDYLVIEGVGIEGWNTKRVTFIENRSSRDVVIQDTAVGNMPFYRNTTAARGQVYFINTCGGPAWPTDTQGEEWPWIYLKGQNAMMWGVDPEIVTEKTYHEKEPFLVIDGGIVVVHGFKCGEHLGPHIRVQNGAQAEFFGGVINTAKRSRITEAMVAFEHRDAALVVVAVEQSRNHTHEWVVRRISRGERADLKTADVPRRKGSRPGGFVIPLYVGK